jgi:hypothetical protein
MPNLALLILITVFTTQAVSWIGKSVLQQIAFSTYSRIFLSSKSKQQRILRKQVLVDKAELSRTSSQDEFAKWARLRRKVDKSLADLEKISTCFLFLPSYTSFFPLPRLTPRHYATIRPEWIYGQILHIPMDSYYRFTTIPGLVV